MPWVPAMGIHVHESNFEHADTLLDATYPGHVDNLIEQSPFYYYVVHYGIGSERPYATFRFDKPLCLSALKLRGENYSDMRHMPRDVKLFCSTNEGSVRAGQWQLVSEFRCREERGWQLFCSRDVNLSQHEAQELCNEANTEAIRPWRTPMDSWKQESPSWATHDGVHLNTVDWRAPEQGARYYKLEVQNNYGSYTALAEVNFWEGSTGNVVVNCMLLPDEDGATCIRGMQLSGTTVGTWRGSRQARIGEVRVFMAEQMQLKSLQVRLLLNDQVLDPNSSVADALGAPELASAAAAPYGPDPEADAPAPYFYERSGDAPEAIGASRDLPPCA